MLTILKQNLRWFRLMPNNKRFDKYALYSFICGIAGLVLIMFFGFIFSLLAIILGIIGILNINKDPNSLKGKWMAITGIILGIIFIVPSLLITFYNVSLPQPQRMTLQELK